MGFFDGSRKEIENGCKSIVDVRDVALAHVRPLEDPSLFGQRFPLVAACPTWTEISKWIRDELREEGGQEGNTRADKVPTTVAKEFAGSAFGNTQPNKTLCEPAVAKSLGIVFITSETMVRDTVKSLRKHYPNK